MALERFSPEFEMRLTEYVLGEELIRLVKLGNQRGLTENEQFKELLKCVDTTLAHISVRRIVLSKE